MIFSLFKRRDDKSAPVYPLSWVTPHLAVGHAPMSYAELQSIEQQSIQAIMNLCLEIEDLVDLEREQGFEVYYLPIADEQAPEVDELEKALDWLDEAIYLGKKVLVHCRHGIGRTGTVVYSYLLRKGLGAKRARKHMNGLRSQPTEHAQRRMLRSYGHKEGELTIGQPCLVPQGDQRLDVFIQRTKAVLDNVDALISETTPRCGRDHVQCCHGIVQVSLAEAIVLQKKMNSSLSSAQREECIGRAHEEGAVLQALHEELQESDDFSVNRSFTHTAAACPLLDNSTCLLFDVRPIQCRLSDLSYPSQGQDVQPELHTLSSQIMEQLSEHKMTTHLPRFSLFDVVSGKFVQQVFHLLAQYPNAGAR